MLKFRPGPGLRNPFPAAGESAPERDPCPKPSSLQLWFPRAPAKELDVTCWSPLFFVGFQPPPPKVVLPFAETLCLLQQNPLRICYSNNGAEVLHGLADRREMPIANIRFTQAHLKKLRPVAGWPHAQRQSLRLGVFGYFDSGVALGCR